MMLGIGDADVEKIFSIIVRTICLSFASGVMDCNEWTTFGCLDGSDCIPVYDTCNGIKQCKDGSDESAELCAQAATTPPAVLPPIQQKQPNKIQPQPARPDITRPNDIRNWGREGERYNPFRPAANNNNNQQQQQQQQQQPQQQQSPFQHKGNSGVQLGPQIPQQQQPQQSWTYPYGLPGNYDYSTYGGYNYGFPQQISQQQGYYFPGTGGNGYNNLAPAQQQQQQPFNPAPPNQPNQQQQQNAQGNASPAKKVTKPPSKKKPTSTIKTTPVPTTTTSTAAVSGVPGDRNVNLAIVGGFASDGDAVKALLKNLTDEDFEVETPSAAIFTLVAGCLLSVLLAIGLGCKMRQLRKPGRKRNLAADADGDYLVNGMYL